MGNQWAAIADMKNLNSATRKNNYYLRRVYGKLRSIAHSNLPEYENYEIATDSEGSTFVHAQV